MSTVTSTSIEAYAGYVASGAQATRQDVVEALFRQYPHSTDREIAVLAGNKDSNWVEKVNEIINEINEALDG